MSIPAYGKLIDLTVSAVDVTNTVTDQITLAVSGIVTATIENIGELDVSEESKVLAYYDVSSNGLFDSGIDPVLGRSVLADTLSASNVKNVEIEISGNLPFRDAPISVWVDSGQEISESNESNNTNTSSYLCRMDPPSSGNFSPKLKWHWRDEKVLSVPLVSPLFDDNLDGVIDQNDETYVIFVSHSSFVDHSLGTLRAVKGSTGEQVWAVTDLEYRTEGSAHPAIGDIDGDGIPEIIMYRFWGGIIAVNNDGSIKWSTSEPGRVSYYNYGSISLADLDGDGLSEILARNHVFNHDGTLRWSAEFTGHANYAVTADLNIDGIPEVLIGGRAYNADGTDYWNNSTKYDGYAAIANFDADDNPEVVVKNGNYIYLYDHTGAVLWTANVIGGGGGAPTVADMDGDGFPEVGVAGRSYYVVYNHDGTLAWASQTQDYSSRTTGSTVFDFDGDGRSEVVYADERYLRVYDGITGSVLFSIPNSSATATEYPVVADIDRDNHAELLLVSDQGTTYGLRVFEDIDDNWVSTRRIWNQHSYHINNVRDDTRIPAHESPSWTAHNTYRLNTFLDRDPLAVADLTATKMVLIDHGDGNPFSVSLVIGNAGGAVSPDGVRLAIYEGDPANGGVILAETGVTSIGTNSYLNIQVDGLSAYQGGDLYAYIDNDEQVQECNEDNNIVSILKSELYSRHGALRVSTDKLVYSPNTPVTLIGNVENTSELAGDFSIRLRIEDLSGAVIQEYEDRTISGLMGGASTSITEGWNTGLLLSDIYRLHGYLYSSHGDLVDESISLFEIRHPEEEAGARLRLATDRPVYHITDQVEIENIISNLTVSTLYRGVSLQVTVSGPTNSSVCNSEISVGELVPGVHRQIFDSCVFSDVADGEYTVSGQLLDSQGNVLSTDMAEFQVTDSLDLSLVGTITAQFNQLESGESQVCTSEIDYLGNRSLTRSIIHRLAVNMDTEEVFADLSQSVDIVNGAALTWTDTFETAGLNAGEYACVLRVETEGTVRNLDIAGFLVKEPPIQIVGDVSEGKGGRVLVLVDEPEQPAGTCTSLTQLSISTLFDLPAAANSELVVRLYDRGNLVIDTEQVTLSDFTGYQNQNSGVDWTDLSISEFGTDKLSVVVDGNNSTNTYLGNDYRVVATLTEGNAVRELDSDLIHTECVEARVVGEHFGVFRIDDIQSLDAANDQHGPVNSPSELAQHTFIQRLLDESGWEYTLVTSDDAFEYEFYHGGYSAYAIFSEQVKLSEPLQKAVREAAYRGEGLLVVGDHDQRNHTLYDALGIRYRGKEPQASGVNLLESEQHAAGQLGLALGDKAVNTEIINGTTTGNFLLNNSDEVGGNALNYQKYGNGNTVHVGYDLLAEATLAGLDSPHADLINSALRFIVPEYVSISQGEVFPVTFTVSNEGVATPGRMLFNLPEGVTLVNAGLAQQGFDGALAWKFTLQEGEVQQNTVWLQLQTESTALIFDARIQSGDEPDYVDHFSISVELAVSPQIEFEQVLSDLVLLDNQNSTYKKSLKWLNQSISDINNGDSLSAISSLLNCADELIKIDLVEAEQMRLDVDALIRQVGLILPTKE
jgi:hypothetical protein